jgi:hypothetical protein
MPHQVQSLITPDYVPIVTVPATAEVITQAALQDTAVALGSRTEYVKQFTDGADKPELFHVVREEFDGAVWDSGQSILHASFPWRTSHTGSPVVTHLNGSARRPGRLKVALPPSSSFNMGPGSAAGGEQTFGFITSEMATFVVKVEDDPANVATQILFGLKEDYSLGNGGDNSLQFFYLKSLATWRLMIRRAAVQTLVDLGVPFVSGEFITGRFIFKSPGPDVDVEVDGVVVHTVDTLDRPTGEFNVGLSCISTGAETEVVNTEFDYLYCRGAGPGATRSGPG